MTTKLQHRGLEAWISCDGAALECWGVETVDRKISCWIASQAGKVSASGATVRRGQQLPSSFSFQSFSINMSDTDGRIATAWNVYIDGYSISKPIVGGPNRRKTRSRDYVVTGPNTRRELSFSTLKMTGKLCNDLVLLSRDSSS